MDTNEKCRECGAPIPSGSPPGFCARCLLNVGLERATEVQSPGSKVQSQRLGQSASTIPSLSAPPRQITEQPGDSIGRYKLLQQIGEGGFGIVYMAQQQEPVKRRVALKIVKLGMDT